LQVYAKLTLKRGWKQSNLKKRGPMREEVEEVLESVRPMLIADGGNVELVDIDDGIVKVRLVGACVSCSSSTMTLKMGIEKALKKAIPMVRCVEAVD
jgi:Fe-S cluster biogenesis protein NfuA